MGDFVGKVALVLDAEGKQRSCGRKRDGEGHASLRGSERKIDLL